MKWLKKMFLKRNQSWKRVTDAKLSGNFLSVRAEYLELLREKIKHLHFLPPKRSNRVRQLKKNDQKLVTSSRLLTPKMKFSHDCDDSHCSVPRSSGEKKKRWRDSLLESRYFCGDILAKLFLSFRLENTPLLLSVCSSGCRENCKQRRH